MDWNSSGEMRDPTIGRNGPQTTVNASFSGYEPGGRRFESCRARQLPQDAAVDGALRAGRCAEQSSATYPQEMLAEIVGTTRSRVNFFMNKFRDLGFIE